MNRVDTEESLKTRWPNKYSISCVICTPDGRSLVFETDLTDVRAEMVVKELSAQMVEPE